jgi:bacterioferritin-associated ferredoxin
MSLCLCHGITDKVIKQAVREDGVGNMRQLRKMLGVGSQCTKCMPMAQGMIDNTIIDKSLFREVC